MRSVEMMQGQHGIAEDFGRFHAGPASHDTWLGQWLHNDAGFHHPGNVLHHRYIVNRV